jgi:hypothetical protein
VGQKISVNYFLRKKAYLLHAFLFLTDFFAVTPMSQLFQLWPGCLFGTFPQGGNLSFWSKIKTDFLLFGSKKHPTPLRRCDEPVESGQGVKRNSKEPKSTNITSNGHRGKTR